MKLSILFFLLTFYISPIFSQELRNNEVPELTGRVVDLTSTLLEEEIQMISSKLEKFEMDTSNQIAVLIVESTLDESIEEFSIRVAEAWELGQKNVDNGVLITIAKKDRRMRIEVGYGLEGVLTDLTSKKIIRNAFIPNFKENKYYEGIDEGINLIIKTLGGEENIPELEEKKIQNSKDDFFSSENGNFIFLVFIVAYIISKIVGLFFESYFLVPLLVTPPLTMIGGLIFFGLAGWLVYLMLGLIAFILLELFLRGGFSGSGGGSGGWSSGGGGFPGGGGSFGGGGASGSW